MADNTASLKIDLDTQQLKGSASSAVEALSKLQSEISGDTKALREMQSTLRALEKATVPNITQISALKTKISKQTESISRSTSALVELGGGMGETGGKAKTLRQKLQGVGAEAKLVGGPMGALAGRFENLSRLAGTGVVRYVVFAGAIAGMGIAAIAAGRALFDLAFASAEARREELLTLQGTLSLTKGIGDAQLAGEDLQETIDQVSGRSAASRDAIVGLGKDLYAAGLRGGALEDALDAAATTAAVQGPAAADAFVKLAIATDKAGGSVAKLATKVDHDLGDIAHAKLLSTAVQAAKFGEAVSGLFANIDIDPLLEARKGFTDLFSQSTSAGRAFKALIEPLAQGLVDGVTAWTTALQKGVVRALIWAIELRIGWLKFELAIHDAKTAVLEFGAQVLSIGEDCLKSSGGQAILVTGLGYLAVALGPPLLAAVGTAVTSLVGLGATFIGTAASAVSALVPALLTAIPTLWSTAAAAFATAAPFLLAAAAVWAVINTTKLLMDLWDEMDRGALKAQLYTDLIEPIQNFAGEAWQSAMNIGGKIIEGIVDGITSGASVLIDAMKSLGTNAWSGFKAVLGIHSPSREFAKLGRQIPAGVEEGISAGQAGLDRTIGNLVSVPAVDLGGSGASSTGGARGTSNVINMTFNIDGAQTPKATADAVADRLRDALMTLKFQMGAA